MIIDPDSLAAVRRGNFEPYPSVQRAPTAQRAAGRAVAGSDAGFAKIAAQRNAENGDGAVATEDLREKAPQKGFSPWQDSAFSFGDLLDVINPLQHLPIVATIYRNMTGDRMGIVPRVVGGALWGRIGGFVSGAVNAVVEWLTGKDIGDHIYAFLRNQLATPEDHAPVARDDLSPQRRTKASMAKEIESAQTLTDKILVPRRPVDDESRRGSPSLASEARSALAPSAIVLNRLVRGRIYRFPDAFDQDRNRLPEQQPKIRLTA